MEAGERANLEAASDRGKSDGKASIDEFKGGAEGDREYKGGNDRKFEAASDRGMSDGKASIERNKLSDQAL